MPLASLPPEFLLRPITTADEDAVKHLTVDTLAEFGYYEDCPANDPELAHMAYYVAENPQAEYYVIEHQPTKTVVGCGGFEPLKGYPAHRQNAVCELIKFYVKEGFRRQGLGCVLLQHALQRATTLGFHSMYYEVTPQLFSQGLFERHGFYFLPEKLGANGHVHPEINIFVIKPLQAPITSD
ncbi:MAG: GNAT family N-acetyltransferase [Vampirovibrionales bacterium]